MAAVTTPLRKDLIFPRAGHFIFVPYGANGMPDLKRAYSSAHGVVVSISRDNSLNTVTLPDGNSPYPAGEYVQTQEGTMTYVLSTYDPELEALIAGAEYHVGDSKDDEMWTINAFIVDNATHAITFEEGAKPISADKLFIKDNIGTEFKAQSSAESLSASGMYHYDSATGKLTFAEADKDKSVIVSYAYKGKDIVSIEYRENPKITTFMAIVVGQTKDKDEATEQNVNIVVDRCTVSGAVTPPTQSNDPTQGWTLTTKVLKSRSGQKPIKVKFEPIPEA